MTIQVYLENDPNVSEFLIQKMHLQELSYQNFDRIFLIQITSLSLLASNMPSTYKTRKNIFTSTKLSTRNHHPPYSPKNQKKLLFDGIYDTINGKHV